MGWGVCTGLGRQLVVSVSVDRVLNNELDDDELDSEEVVDVIAGRTALKRSDGGGRVSCATVCCGISSTEGLGESGGVSNSAADESLVSSVNEGVLDLGVLAGESSGGVGEGEGDGVVDAGPSNGTTGTCATSSDRGLCLPGCLSLPCANGKDARQTLMLGSA